MKILVTGAHFTPAQAVITELQKMGSYEIVYVGRKYTREGDNTPSVESQLIPQIGVKFIPIITGRLQRTLTLYTIPSLLKIPVGFVSAFCILLKEKPNVILSFGGYVAVPIVIAAWLLSIPIIIHEQTLVSGLANIISSFFANKIAVTFEKDYQFKKEKIVVTGNPIRQEILEIKSLKPREVSLEIRNFIALAKREKKPVILITGGNQGSHIINQNIAALLKKLTEIAFVIHQTGDSKFQDYETLINLQTNLPNPNRYLVKKWIDTKDMAYILNLVDLVVSRAGINTLIELSYFGIPTLVIPLPYIYNEVKALRLSRAYKNEQEINAKFFEKAGLCQILPQSKLNEESLLQKIKEMLRDLGNLKKVAEGARDVVILNAAKKLALETILLGEKVR